MLNEIYPKLPKISIDYAVMEPASQGKGKAQVVGRRDARAVARRRLLARAGRDAADRRARQRRRRRRPASSSTRDDNIVVSEDPEHLVTPIGVSDMIIVHTQDATLVCPKSEAQRVKELVGKVKEKFGNKYQ